MNLSAKDPVAARDGAGPEEMFKAARPNDPTSKIKASSAQEGISDPASVKRARRALLLDSIYEQMQAAHHQADLVMLFAETGDHRGINRQLTFLTEAVVRAVQSSADISALKT
jgi:hypothetical protein